MTIQAVRQVTELIAEQDKRRATLVANNQIQRYTGLTFTADALRFLDPIDQPKRLVNCNLSGLDLSQIDLSHYVFDACDLSDTRFNICHHAKFYSCNLRRTKLTGADFRWVETLNCRFDGADLLGMQITVDCNIRRGMRTELAHDIHLLLHWLALPGDPLTAEIRDAHTPERVRSILDATFAREL